MKRICFYLLSLCVCFVSHAASPGTPAWSIAAGNKKQFNSITSKTSALAEELDLTGVFTAIDAIDTKAKSSDSLIDIIAVTLMATSTAIDASVSKTCLIEEDIQTTQDNVIGLSNAFGQPITDADVGLSGLTINTSGKYTLCEVIDTTATNAITISADNVELDLNGFSIVNAGTAINITSGVTNVCIANGTIADTTSEGFVVDGASKVFINDLWIDSATDNGLLATSCSELTIQNTRITQTGGSPAHGFSFISNTNLVLDTCLSTENTGNGFNFENCNRVILSQGMGNDNVQGISFNGCNEIQAEQCIAHDNSDNGIFVGNTNATTNGLIKGCICISNDDAGIFIANNSSQIKVIETISAVNFQGIQLDTGSNCYVFENITHTNGTNVDESAGGPNSILSNWALASSSGDNYNASASTINEVTINQSGSFPSEPTKWQNISMET